MEVEEKKCIICGERASCFVYDNERVTNLCLEHYRMDYKKMEKKEDGKEEKILEVI
jgi:hypothetical protein